MPFRKSIVVVLVLYFSVTTITVYAQSSAPPNIVIVMTDDHAQWALGSYGLDQIETPNIDWLANRGVKFENAMSPSPVCSSARASFHTGKMPSQHGVHDFLSEAPEYDANWLAGETLLSERLIDLGYRTALFGKWHATTDSRPPQRGFDRWLSYNPYKAGWQNQYLKSGLVHFSDDGNEVQYTGVQARFLTEEAIRFIDEPSDKPFFISLNFTEPHAPFEDAPQRLVDKYLSIAESIVRAGGSSDMPDRGAMTTVPDNHIEQLAQYLAAISLIDDQVGRLLDALSGRNLVNNTLLVFTADHGLLMGQYGLYGKTNATNPANFYEETIRIPMIILAPGEEIRQRQTRGEFVDLLDLHATVIDFASNGRDIDSAYGPGRSMRPLLTGQRQANWRSLQFAERGRSRMATDGRWKLVRHHQSGNKPTIDNWYDLTHPFGERLSTSTPGPEVKAHLIGELEAFFEQYETPEHTGRDVWNQPPPNARAKRDREELR